MTFTRNLAFLGLLATLGTIARPAHAQFITPSGYTYSAPPEGQAQGGGFNYFDETGVQLIDGVLGANDWAANLGNGNAFEWVGWRNANPTITFNFTGTVNITQFQIGVNNFVSGGVNQPTSISINGVVYNLTGNEVPAGQRGFINFAQAFSGNSVQINLTDNTTGSWIFVDEVRFVGQAAGAAAPEPASLLFLGLGACLGAGYARRRRPTES